ncbi:hypothetical protein RhiirC2_791239 [Rhizophagus irregularis]|uniref:Uncharacterized protein n=1 Tax=Rhizophagus irregularis TaxID=588596 RepID=A0A2N1MJL4_9GLOM|nr:hypothetical protein RhiirC2_791239 [Rhizophagus irregularis]
MEKDLGKGLQMKSQDELIGEEGMYKKRLRASGFKVPTQTTSKDKFVDANSLAEREKEIEDKDKINNNKKRVVTMQG